MRYVIRTLLGMGLFAFGWVAIAYGIFQFLQIGTCASGGRPPWTYRAPLDGEPVMAGGATPEPVTEPDP